MIEKYIKVDYNNKTYIVGNCKEQPFIIDEYNYEKIKELKFRLTNGYIYICNSNVLLLHHIIKPYNNISIDHINRIKTDNREANLRYATQTEQNKNQSKKKRNVVLPENCGVNAEDIPTFIWYIKPDKHHGDRWMIEIKDRLITRTLYKWGIKCRWRKIKKRIY